MRQDIRQTLARAAAGKLHCGSQPRARDEINETFPAMRRDQLLGRLVLTP
jgi:D-arabinose 1-dehydrogenase-like Zn-dependent alcohol dehydrogenase